MAKKKASKRKPPQSSASIDQHGRLVRPADADCPDVIRVNHDLGIDSFVYERQLQALAPNDDLHKSALYYLEQYLDEMKPRNPAERMLAIQMRWVHLRIGRLLQVAESPANYDLELFKGVSEAIDKLLNTSRRLMKTWDEMRTPRPIQFIKGSQVNMAEQQVVANGPVQSKTPEGDRANEQGFVEQAPTQALPLEPPGPIFTSSIGSEEQAVDAEHGSTDAGREGAVEPERAQARPSKRRGPRARSRGR